MIRDRTTGQPWGGQLANPGEDNWPTLGGQLANPGEDNWPTMVWTTDKNMITNTKPPEILTEKTERIPKNPEEF
ncbi:hypothetical protein DdX_15145 [Ditylenchus destructor]|uniref:Uncharacterized protein n=1 Tax=Ditylenchus destructor TaxID=166010 RepID=A0AAD4MVN2_9BILA|nr:hypothetical protein DdX_15145 [Ditylenchus destructor]